MKDFNLISWVAENIGYPIAGAVTALITYLFTKKQYDAQVQSTESQAKNTDAQTESQKVTTAGMVIDRWIQLVERLEKNVTELSHQLEAQREACERETNELNKKIADHEKRINELEEENHSLRQLAEVTLNEKKVK